MLIANVKNRIEKTAPKVIITNKEGLMTDYIITFESNIILRNQADANAKTFFESLLTAISFGLVLLIVKQFTMEWDIICKWN